MSPLSPGAVPARTPASGSPGSPPVPRPRAVGAASRVVRAPARCGRRPRARPRSPRRARRRPRWRRRSGASASCVLCRRRVSASASGASDFGRIRPQARPPPRTRRSPPASGQAHSRAHRSDSARRPASGSDRAICCRARIAGDRRPCSDQPCGFAMGAAIRVLLLAASSRCLPRSSAGPAARPAAARPIAIARQRPAPLAATGCPASSRSSVARSGGSSRRRIGERRRDRCRRRLIGDRCDRRLLRVAADVAEVVQRQREHRLAAEAIRGGQRLRIDRLRRDPAVRVGQQRLQRAPAQTGRNRRAHEIENRRQQIDVLHGRRPGRPAPSRCGCLTSSGTCSVSSSSGPSIAVRDRRPARSSRRRTGDARAAASRHPPTAASACAASTCSIRK